mmetsp:Transcript_32226/g.94880  ORF Transcript_32226/g.94880 Transcript_32226/m.94880 type:complete len:515 (-) Transcript_32226:746-2290(-)
MSEIGSQSAESSTETTIASPEESTSDSFRSEESLDGGRPKSLAVSPNQARAKRAQPNVGAAELSPIASVNETHVHDASIASPSLGGGDEDDTPPVLTYGEEGDQIDSGVPSPEPRNTTEAVNGEQQEEEEAGNDDEFSASNDEKIQENKEEQEGPGLAGPPDDDDDTTADNSSALDAFSKQPSELALATASNAFWWRGARFNRDMTIYGVRAKLSELLHRKGRVGIDACHIYVQTKPRGSYRLYSRRKNDCGSFVVDLLREMGQEALLLAVAESAYLGDARTHEIPGGAKDDSPLHVDPRDVQTDDDGVRIANDAFCVPDSILNCLVVDNSALALAPASNAKDLSVTLRILLCDKYGKAPSFGEVMEGINKSYDLPVALQRCTNKRLPGIQNVGFKGKLQYLVALSAKERRRMFILQCVSKTDGSTGHYVALRAGVIYDNCASTGGKFDATEYANEFLSGVRKAAEIIICPRSTKKKRKKRGLSAQQGDVKVEGEGTGKKAKMTKGDDPTHRQN